MSNQIQQLFKNPEIYQIYQKLIEELEKFGKVIQEPKKDSIHLKNKKGFAGVHPKISFINLEIVSDHKLKGPKVLKNRPSI